MQRKPGPCEAPYHGGKCFVHIPIANTYQNYDRLPCRKCGFNLLCPIDNPAIILFGILVNKGLSSHTGQRTVTGCHRDQIWFRKKTLWLTLSTFTHWSGKECIYLLTWLTWTVNVFDLLCYQILVKTFSHFNIWVCDQKYMWVLSQAAWHQLQRFI